MTQTLVGVLAVLCCRRVLSVQPRAHLGEEVSLRFHIWVSCRLTMVEFAGSWAASLLLLWKTTQWRL